MQTLGCWNMLQNNTQLHDVHTSTGNQITLHSLSTCCFLVRFFIKFLNASHPTRWVFVDVFWDELLLNIDSLLIWQLLFLVCADEYTVAAFYGQENCFRHILTDVQRWQTGGYYYNNSLCPPNHWMYSVWRYTVPRQQYPVHTYCWTQSDIILLKQLTFAQLPNKLPQFYGIPKIRYGAHKSRHWFLLWVRWIQSATFHPISVRSILILSSILCSNPSSVSSVQLFWLKLCLYSNSFRFQGL